jgi:Family of unknown function (DUF5996)
MRVDEWPPLPYNEWRDTRDTLHMYTQVVGKIRLALSPFEPQWANVPLYVTARGLTTSPVPKGLRTFDMEFDLVGHQLVVRTSDGGVEQIPLRPRAVADFYGDVMSVLARLGVDVTISRGPSEVPDPIPFAEDRVHHSYDPGQANRFFRVLSQVDVVFKAHRARFKGKSPPVHFFWGSFDLAVTRFSGRTVTPPPGAGTIERYGGDAEQICALFWPGNEAFRNAAFVAYPWPAVEGIETAAIQPDAAGWNTDLGEFLLTYDDVLAAPSPERAIRDFLESTYAVCAERLDWNPDLTRVDAPS